MAAQSEQKTAVLIAAYNAEATLERAIVSALAAAETAEVCIVDDKSRDRTFAIASAWAERDPRVRALQQRQNAGPAAARNLGIEATTAPWLAILDADDYLLEGRFARLHSRAQDADFVADTLVRTTEGRDFAFTPTAFAPSPLTLEGFLLGDLPSKTGLNLGFLKPMMRRAFLDRHGLRYNETLRLGEDFDLYARALAYGARFVLGGPTGYVSIERPGSLSLRHGSAELARLHESHEAIKAVRSLSASEARALRRHWRFVDRRLQWSRFVDAFKARDLSMLLSALGSPHAAWYVTRQLAEQAWLRGTAFARGRAAE